MKWDSIYDKLKAYKEKHGHCKVPKSYVQDKELANWASKQREQYMLYQDVETRKSRKCKLTSEKVAKLDAIGFQWNVDDGNNTNNKKTTSNRRAAPPTDAPAITATFDFSSGGGCGPIPPFGGGTYPSTTTATSSIV